MSMQMESRPLRAERRSSPSAARSVCGSVCIPAGSRRVCAAADLVPSWPAILCNRERCFDRCASGAAQAPDDSAVSGPAREEEGTEKSVDRALSDTACISSLLCAMQMHYAAEYGRLVAVTCRDSDLMTALCATAIKDGLACLGLHAGQEAVGLCATTAVRLKSALWHGTALLLDKENLSGVPGS